MELSMKYLSTPSPIYDIDFSITISVSEGIIDINLVNSTVNQQLQISFSDDEYKLQYTVIANGASVIFEVIVFDDDNFANLDKQAMEEALQETLNRDDDTVEYTVSISYDELEEVDANESTDTYLILFVIAAVLALSIIFAYAYAKWIYVNNYFRIGSLITTGIHLMDAISDILFAMAVSYNIILISAIIFIVLPILLTMYQLYRAINEWKRNDELSQWISDNVQILYIFSVLTGSSFAGVALCTSSAFSLYQTSLPLNKTQILHFQTKRMYSIVLLENLPQLGLQIYSLIADGGSDIVYISMAFSILSVIISILSMASQRSVVRSRDFVSVEYDIKGEMIVSNMKRCKNLKNQLQLHMSSMVGIEQELVEIVKPKQIKQGLKITINFYVNNTRAIDMNIKHDINKAASTGELATIMKKSWSLSSEPTIENIKCIKHDSKDRRDNTEVIKVNSESQNAKDDNQGETHLDHLNAQIAIGEIHGNHEYNVSELPPMVAQPVTSGGETIEGESGSDDCETLQQASVLTGGDV